MILDDAVAIGSLIANVGLTYIAICHSREISELQGFRRVIEIMQDRGMLPSMRELDRVLLQEQRQQTQQVEEVYQQRSLPPAQRTRRVPNKGTAQGYDPENESHLDEDVETIIEQPRRRRASVPARSTAGRGPNNY